MSANASTGPIEELAGASARFADFIATTRYETLPPKVVHAFKRALLDYISCAVSGAAMPVSRALIAYFEENDATRHAAVVGQRTRLSAPNAALVNGANTHGLDFDDGNTQASAHPAGAIFPATLAAAERHGASPRDIIVAAAVGYDVMIRIAATVHPVSARNGYHNTSIAGVFGAAAAASSILGLNSKQALDALGMAGSFSGGIREYLAEGAEIKRVHPGKAARDGVLCAELARRGITGPSQVLEGPMGFFNTVGRGLIRAEQLLAGLGERYAIAENYFKPYPCCRHYHSILDGIKQLHASHTFSAADIEHVDIGLYGVGALGHGHQQCETLLEAQMSAPCAAALAIVEGDVTAAMFLPDSLSRPEVTQLMLRIDTGVDPECDHIYPKIRSGVVTIELKNGKQLQARVVEPKGELNNPMTDEDLEHKFRSNCSAFLDKERLEEVLRAVWAFDGQADAGVLYRW